MTNKKNNKQNKEKKTKKGSKKLVNKEKKPAGKKIEKNNNSFVVWLIAVVIVSVVVFFVARAAFQSERSGSVPSSEKIILDNIDQEDAFMYNGLPFRKEGGYWKTEIQIEGVVYEIVREYSPREVEDLDIVYNRNNFSDLLRKYRRVYFSFDPDAQGANYAATVGVSMARSLKEVYGVNMIPACVVNSTICQDRPIVSCNSTEYPVIQVIPENQTSIVYDNNCLDLRGSGDELIRAGDKVIYGWYGITE